jgi:hypothetical protein
VVNGQNCTKFESSRLYIFFYSHGVLYFMIPSSDSEIGTRMPGICNTI